MPKRPPKAWWHKCVRAVSHSGGAYSPASVCGKLWYHKMSPEARRFALATERAVRVENERKSAKRTAKQRR